MTGIIRSPRPPKGWTEIPDSTIRDSRLSYRARGVLVRLLSNADGYRMTAEDLALESRDGRQAVLTALRELREAGYVVVVKTQDARGRFRTETYVFDYPQPNAEGGKTEVGEPDSGSPDAGSPDAGCSNSFINKEYQKKNQKEQQHTRTRARACAREEAQAPSPPSAAAALQQPVSAAPTPPQGGKARRRRASGIVTWNDSDIAEAERLEAAHPPEALAEALAVLAKAGLEPVPGRVAQALERLEKQAIAQAAHQARLAAAAATAPPQDPEALARGRAFLENIRKSRHNKGLYNDEATV